MSGSEYDDEEEDLRAEIARLRKENAVLKKREADRSPVAPALLRAKKGKIELGTNGQTDVKKALASLFVQVKRNVKKQGHTWQKKPRAEPATAVWSEAVWNAATKGLAVTGKTTKKVTVPPAFAVKELGWDVAIHPVKFTGKMFMLEDDDGQRYSYAAYDNIVLSYAH